MKYIKKFEDINIPLKKGDFVVMSDYGWDEINYFVENNIGIYQKPGANKNNNYNLDKIIVKYKNIPIEIESYFYKNGNRYFDLEDMLYHSSNKEDCEAFINSRKYNI